LYNLRNEEVIHSTHKPQGPLGLCNRLLYHATVLDLTFKVEPQGPHGLCNRLLHHATVLGLTFKVEPQE